MLLQEISNEFLKVEELVLNKELGFEDIMLEISDMNYYGFTLGFMISLSDSIRKISKIQGILESERFLSKNVQTYVDDFIKQALKFYEDYDNLMSLLADRNIFYKRNLSDEIYAFRDEAKDLYDWAMKIRHAINLLTEATNETWEPLPTDLEVECENIIISSETKGTTLGDISKDIESFDCFLNSIYSLVNKDQDNSYFLRKVETGSLSVVISCTTAVPTIVSFIFWIIKLCQHTEKRNLINKDKQLDIINKNLDIAKKILEIDPQNTEANEVIVKCGYFLLQFLGNNPKGTINGEKYDIGAEILRIEEKKDE